MLERHLLWWLLASSSVALVWPRIFPGIFDPWVASKPCLNLAIALVMFFVGCLLKWSDVAAVGRRWPAVLLGTVTQYTVMPAAAYLIGHAFEFSPELLIGVVMVGCVPGAMASNVITLSAGGNLSYSVALTTSSTFLSPVVVPLLLWLTLGATHKVDMVQTGVMLVLQVVLPVLLGLGLCRGSAAFQRLAERWAPSLANLMILWVIATVVGLNRDRLGSVRADVLVALLLINLLGYVGGYWAAAAMRSDEPMRRTLAIEVGMQNCGLGTTLVLHLFPDYPAAAIPTAAYTFGCVLTATLLARHWSRQPVVEAAPA